MVNVYIKKCICIVEIFIIQKMNTSFLKFLNKIMLKYTPFFLICMWLGVILIRGDNLNEWISDDISRILHEDKTEFFIVICMLISLVIRECINTTKSYTKDTRIIIFRDKQCTFPNNTVKTTRYSMLTLLPYTLLEYIMDISNIYFEIVIFFQVVTPWSPTGKHGTYPGVIIAFIGKFIMILLEEIKRSREDHTENFRPYDRLIYEQPTNQWITTIHNKDILPGYVIIIHNGEQIPVDGLIIGSSDGCDMDILVKETSLTGETAPSCKHVLNIWEGKIIKEQKKYHKLLLKTKGYLKCKQPNSLVTNFEGEYCMKEFNHESCVFRGSKLEGTDWILVYTIYTGDQTKLGQCFDRTPIKHIPLDKKFKQTVITWNFVLMAVLIFIPVMYNWLKFKSFEHVLPGIVSNFLYVNGLNNLSTHMIGDIARMGQSIMLSEHPHLDVHISRNTPDVLGMVDVIISDKTGTLTCNHLNLQYIYTDHTLFDFRNETICTPEFIQAMCLCNGVMIKNGQMYSPSPDDLEFVNASSKCGYTISLKYTKNNTNYVHITSPDTGEKIYEILNINPFNSHQKYMSILVKDTLTNCIYLYVKGAESVIKSKLCQSQLIQYTACHNVVSSYEDTGFRLLYWAVKRISIEDINKQLEILEDDLNFLGVTCIEDTLRDNVFDTIQFIQMSGIKFVMATGDSVSTAIAIWKQLFGHDTSQQFNIITHKSYLFRNNDQNMVLVIDGDILHSLNSSELSLICRYKYIIAARVSGVQKKLIVEQFNKSGSVTLAIGDGANDVAMLQHATVGIAVESKETDAAQRASDFKLDQFRGLKTLLIVGSQCYTTLCKVYLWNDYKSLMLALIPYISRAIHGFSGDPLIPGDVIFVLTTVILSYPLIIFGIFGKVTSYTSVHNQPELYNAYKKQSFNTNTKRTWWLSCILHCFIILTFTYLFMSNESNIIKGLTAAQMICIVSNIKLLTQAFNLSNDNPRLSLIVISCITSIVLLLPISKINVLYDKELRLRLGGDLTLPNLTIYHYALSGFVGVLSYLLDSFIH